MENKKKKVERGMREEKKKNTITLGGTTHFDDCPETAFSEVLQLFELRSVPARGLSYSPGKHACSTCETREHSCLLHPNVIIGFARVFVVLIIRDGCRIRQRSRRDTKSDKIRDGSTECNTVPTPASDVLGESDISTQMRVLKGMVLNITHGGYLEKEVHMMYALLFTAIKTIAWCPHNDRKC